MRILIISALVAFSLTSSSLSAEKKKQTPEERSLVRELVIYEKARELYAEKRAELKLSPPRDILGRPIKGPIQSPLENLDSDAPRHPESWTPRSKVEDLAKSPELQDKYLKVLEDRSKARQSKSMPTRWELQIRALRFMLEIEKAIERQDVCWWLLDDARQETIIENYHEKYPTDEETKQKRAELETKYGAHNIGQLSDCLEIKDGKTPFGLVLKYGSRNRVDKELKGITGGKRL